MRSGSLAHSKNVPLRVVVSALAAVASMTLCANLLENSNFEEGELGKGVHRWGNPAPYYSIEAQCGMNGTRALVCDAAKTGGSFTDFVCQYIPVSPGVKLRLSCVLRTEALVCEGERNEGAAIGLTAYNAKGEKVGGGDIWGPSGDTDWKVCERTYSGFGKDVVKVRVHIFVDRPKSGKAFYDDVRLVEVLPVPVDGMASSAYRNTAADGTVTFAAGVNPSSAGLKESDVTGVFVMGGVERPADTMTSGMARISIIVNELPMGESDVVFRLLNKADGRILGAATNRFTRVERMPERKVWFDSARRAIVDGKPFFPLGMYCSACSDGFISVYTNGPFNCAMPYWTIDRAALDRAAAAGIKIMCNVKDCWGGTKNEFYVKRGVKTDDDAHAYVLRKVNEFRSHPALLAWYINDEADVKLMPKYENRYSLIADADPDHPAVGVIYQFAESRGYMSAHDVLGIDPYPVPKDAISRVLDETRVFAKQTFALMPAWHVPQVFDWTVWGGKGARPPTEDEIRNMTWQAIAGGANGIIYYAYHGLMQNEKRKPFMESWAECCRVGEEVKSLFPVLLADPAEGFTVSGAPEHLGWRAWKRGDETYLLLVNATREKMEATLGLPAGTTLVGKEFGHGKAKNTAANQLEVSFEPLDVAIFRLGSFASAGRIGYVRGIMK